MQIKIRLLVIFKKAERRDFYSVILRTAQLLLLLPSQKQQPTLETVLWLSPILSCNPYMDSPFLRAGPYEFLNLIFASFPLPVFTYLFPVLFALIWKFQALLHLWAHSSALTCLTYNTSVMLHRASWSPSPTAFPLSCLADLQLWIT